MVPNAIKSHQIRSYDIISTDDVSIYWPSDWLLGDSPKVAGCMDLLRVQGRWGAAVRLAWVRSVLKTGTDVCGGRQLSKTAPNSFPTPAYFDQWAEFLDKEFSQHMNNIIKPRRNTPAHTKGSKAGNSKDSAEFKYCIDASGERQLVKCLAVLLRATTTEKHLFTDVNPHPAVSSLDGSSRGQASSHSHASSSDSPSAERRTRFNITDWSEIQLTTFLSCTVRGFLRGDLYNAMTEFLSRAEGSFGLQVSALPTPSYSSLLRCYSSFVTSYYVMSMLDVSVDIVEYLLLTHHFTDLFLYVVLSPSI